MPANKDTSGRKASDSELRLIADWGPANTPIERWETVARFVRGAVVDFVPFSNQVHPRDLLRLLASYTIWAHSIAGCDLTREAVFDHEQIAYFYASVVEGVSFSSRTASRAHLMRMADFLVPERRRTVRMPSYPKPSACAPYNPDEIRQIRAWPMEQSTEYRQHAASCIVNFGLGAGLRASELSGLRREDVSKDDQGVLVSVSGEHPRIVPVLAVYEDACIRLALAVEPGAFVYRSNRTAHGASVIGAWSGRLETEMGFLVNLSRLRATWLIGHLNRGVPTNAITTVGGFQTFTGFDRYLPWMEPARLDDCRSNFRQAIPSTSDSDGCPFGRSLDNPAEQGTHDQGRRQ